MQYKFNSLKIVIDTNIFTKDKRRRAAAFESLEKLSNQGIVDIYIPEVVAREIVTQRTIELKAFANSAKKALGKIQSEGVEKIEDEVKDLREKLVTLRGRIETEIVQDFAQWMDRVGAKTLTNEDGDASAIIDAYFKGDPPFKDVKNRNDFPDAFIWWAILHLVEEVKCVHVLSEDNGILSACEKHESVYGHSSLEDFLRSSAVGEAEKDLKYVERHLRETDFAKRILALFAENPKRIHDLITNELRSMLEGSEVQDTSMVPLDFGSVYIGDVIDDYLNEYGFNKAIILPGGVISLPVSFNVEAVLEYWITDQGMDEHVDMSDSKSSLKDAHLVRDRWPTGNSNGYNLEVGEVYALGIDLRVSLYVESIESASDLSDEDLIGKVLLTLEKIDNIIVHEPILT